MARKACHISICIYLYLFIIKVRAETDYIVTYGYGDIKRYYHLFNEETLMDLLSKCDCEIIKLFTDKTGICAIISKKHIINQN